MFDPKLVEAMAQAIRRDGLGTSSSAATVALTALCAARPDVAAVLRGEAVAVPREEVERAAGDGGGPTNDDAAFLAYIEGAAEAQTPVTAEDVARLRRLANYAEGAPPLHWTGKLDRYETRKAVRTAQRRMEVGNE